MFIDDHGVSTLIDEFLAEQRQVTAALKFSAWHEEQARPSLESSYRDLIPLSAPGPGEQYAFVVDLDRCSGCKACVTACHALNGLDPDESWREVGLLLGENSLTPSPAPTGSGAPCGAASVGWEQVNPRAEQSCRALQQTVTTACHHCLEPACLTGCPVLAYDKDPATGIVRHLDDQCIGCSYCVMMCPYEVPRYSAQRGIVRKCDLCHGRLAEGEAPACVQACPSQAIEITLVDTAALRQQIRDAKAPGTADSQWLPDSPDPRLTLPTTRFLSTKQNQHLLAADHGQPRVAATHWPLVLMLVFTQAGMGALVAAAPLGATSAALAGLLFFSLGLISSVFHLGQPRKAWRVWLGWRTSWLSREAIMLNTFAAAGLVLAVWWSKSGGSGLGGARFGAGLTWLFGAVALVTVFAQTMVYTNTRRRFWSASSTMPRFFGTLFLGGAAAALWSRPAPLTAATLMALTMLKLALELAVLKHADCDQPRWTALRRTAALQLGALRGWLGVRLLLGFTGGVVVPFASITGGVPASWVGPALLLCLAGELAERVLFFASVSPDKMPGTT